MECGAILDVCHALQVVDPSLYQEGKNLLVRIIVMLTKMCFVRSKIEHEHELMAPSSSSKIRLRSLGEAPLGQVSDRAQHAVGPDVALQVIGSELAGLHQ